MVTAHRIPVSSLLSAMRTEAPAVISSPAVSGVTEAFSSAFTPYTVPAAQRDAQANPNNKKTTDLFIIFIPPRYSQTSIPSKIS